ncbi:MAG: hypothetical protein AAGH87_05985 [Pseudomonadota bacterium]
MAKRTSKSDAQRVVDAGDLEDVVRDKRAGWRASGAKARRRQRRYKKLVLSQIVPSDDAGEGLDPGEDAITR